MHRSRSAAVVLLPFLLLVPPASVQAADAPQTFFGDVCKAGYVYTLSSTATGFSVQEVQKVDCMKKDANGQFVNAAVPECRDRTGDITWGCAADSTGQEKCNHKICKEGEPTSVSALAPLTSQSIRAAVNEAPANMGQDSIVRPWTPGSASSLDKLLQAGYAPGGFVPNTGGGQGGAPASQDRSAYDSILLYGGPLQEYGGSSAKTPEAPAETRSTQPVVVAPQVPGASDAYTLQGGVFPESPAAPVQTSRETGGVGGQNTFESSRVVDTVAEATPAPCTSGVWTCWVTQTWANLTSGKVFSSSAEAHTPDSQMNQSQPNVTTLAVTQNNPADAPSGLFSTQPLESAQQSGPLSGINAKNPWSISPAQEDNSQTGIPQPLGARQPVAANVVPSADMDTMTPAQLRAIQDQMSADRSAQAQAEADAAKQKTAAPPSTYAKANAVFGAAFEVLGGGSTDKLKTAWKDYVTTLDNNSRAVPVAPVQMVDLPPVPGTERTQMAAGTPSETTVANYMKEVSTPLTPAEVDKVLANLPLPPVPVTFDPAVDEQVRSVLSQKISDAQAQVQYAQDLLARSESHTAQALAQTFLNDSKNRLDAIVGNAIDISVGNPSPAVQSAIEQANKGQGIIAGALQTSAGYGTGWANYFASNIDPANMSLGDVARGTGWLAAETWSVLNSAAGDLGGKIGLPGFNPDAATAIGNAIDPYGSEYKTIGNVAAIAPFGIAPAKSLINGGLDAAVGSTGGAWSSLPRSVTSDVLFSDSAGFTSSVPKVAIEAVGPAAERGLATVSGDAITSAGTKAISEIRGNIDVALSPKANTGVDAFANLAGEINTGVAGAPKSSLESLGQLPRSGTVFDEAPGITAAPRVPESLGQLPKSGTIFDEVPGTTAVPKAPESLAELPKSGTIFDTAPRTVSGEVSARAPGAAAAQANPMAPPAALTDFVAGARTVPESAASDLTPGSWTGGAAFTGGILCLGFCPSSEPLPEKALEASVLGLTREDIALLFPQSDIGKEESAKKSDVPPPASVTMPVGIATEQEVAALFTNAKPAEELPPAAAVPPPAAPEEAVATPLPAQAPTSPFLTPVSPEPIPDPLPPPDMKRQLAAEEAQKVMEEVERVRAQNLASDRAEQETRAQRLAEMQEQIRQQQAALDAQIAAQQAADEAAAKKKAEEEAVQLAQPVMTPAPVVGTGTGPNADTIAQGLSGNATVSGGANSSPRVSIPIQFVDNTAFPTPEGNVTINSLGEAASKEKFKGYSFTIEGYTDPRTPSATWGHDNVRLSQARAEAVRQTIATFYNIPLSSITAIGMGAANPVMNNSGVIDNAASRRVVVTAIPPKR